ncbi:unnamed protein product [Rangifer tarandus platyrhynchus]|uniref:Uncharacterized protein n=1 Tax=Rangifer tarandus platyrhynchus TaxID=3082113 RepID=A0AC60AAE8_RANTA
MAETEALELPWLLSGSHPPGPIDSSPLQHPQSVTFLTLAQLSPGLMTARSGSQNSFPYARSYHPGLSSEQQKSHPPPGSWALQCLPRHVTKLATAAVWLLHLASAPPGP